MILRHVDIVFAFAVVMLLLSLIITILAQIFVAVGGLRGRNLIWGVTKVLEHSPKLKGHANEITNKALRHPALTPTGKTAKENFMRDFSINSLHNYNKDHRHIVLYAMYY